MSAKACRNGSSSTGNATPDGERRSSGAARRAARDGRRSSATIAGETGGRDRRIAHLGRSGVVASGPKRIQYPRVAARRRNLPERVTRRWAAAAALEALGKTQLAMALWSTNIATLDPGEFKMLHAVLLSTPEWGSPGIHFEA
jgi:hypothetical protein